MKTPFHHFETNKQKEQEGVWVDYGDYGFLVQRVGPSNKDWVKQLNLAMLPHRKKYQNGEVPDDVADNIVRSVFCKHGINTWRCKTEPKGDWQLGKMLDKKGELIQFSEEEAERLFIQLPDLFNDLYQESVLRANFLAEQDEDIAGN